LPDEKPALPPLEKPDLPVFRVYNIRAQDFLPASLARLWTEGKTAIIKAAIADLFLMQGGVGLLSDILPPRHFYILPAIFRAGRPR